MKNQETLRTKSTLDSTMKTELMKAWAFDLKRKVSSAGIETADALESASDALKVAEHFLLLDSVSESVDYVVHQRLVTEVMDLINGINLCVIAIEDLDS